MDSYYSHNSNNGCEPITSVFIQLAKEDHDASDNAAIKSFLKGIGQMFYIVNPSETTFSDLEEVPEYFRNAWPYFLLFMIIENIILWADQKPTYRLNDSLTSLSHGLIQHSGKLLFRGAESYAYFFIYEHYRLVNLAWDYPLTWYLAAVGVDFCYYWVHRACHEIHILWAQHQVHHSSEEFNIAVGLRQSILQGWCGFVTGREKYDVKLPSWCNVYLLLHFCVVVYGFQLLASCYMNLNPLSVFAFVIYIIASLTTIGMLFDKHSYAYVFELLRCMVLITAIQRLDFTAIDSSVLLTIEVFFTISGLFWFLQSVKIIQISTKTDVNP